MAISLPSASSTRRRLGAHLSDPLYRTGYYLILGTGITGGLGLAFWALAAQAYSARTVGLNAAAISAVLLVSGVCTLGLSPVLVRYLPVAGRSSRMLVARSYGVTVALSLVLGAAVALTSPLWSPKLDFLAEGGWLIGFALATAAMTVFQLQDSVLIGLQSAKWVPLENALYSFAKLLLLVALVSALPHSGPFVAWNVPLAAAVLPISILIFRRLIPGRPSEGSLDRRQLVMMAAGNYGGLLSVLAGAFYLPILVANLTTAAEAAYFYVPWTICLTSCLVAVNVMTSLTVEAAIDMAPQQLRQLARRTVAHTMRLVCPLAAVTAIAAPWIMLAFGDAYADAGTPLLRMFAASLIPNVFVLLGVSVARIEHRGRVVVAIEAAQAVILLGLSAILVPSMGIKAVGVAWFVSQAAIAIVLLGGLLRPLLLLRRWPGGPARPAADA